VVVVVGGDHLSGCVYVHLSGDYFVSHGGHCSGGHCSRM